MKFEDKVKIYHKIFKFCFTISLVAFLTLYLSQATGYYEYEQHKTATFTSKQIKQFEKDVAEGKNIDMKKYLENSNKDYSNRMSDLGYELSIRAASRPFLIKEFILISSSHSDKCKTFSTNK